MLLIGRLFGNQADNTTKTEIVLSITPRVLRNLPRREPHELEFESGTETTSGSAWAVSRRRRRARRSRASPRGSSPGGGPAALAGVPAAAGGGAAAAGSGASVAGGRPVVAGSGAAAAAGGTTAPAGTSVSPAQVASGPAVLQWHGPAQVKSGETFTLQLAVQSAVPLESLPVVVGFDPQLVQVVDVGEGDFLRQGGAATTFFSRVDASVQIAIAAARSGGGTGGSGALAI